MAQSINQNRINYLVELRQDWIFETLRVFGFIGTIHLVRKFGISRHQARIEGAD